MMVSSVIHCEIKAVRSPDRRWREGYEVKEDIEASIPSVRLGEGSNASRPLYVLEDLVPNTASITEVGEEVGLRRDRVTQVSPDFEYVNII